jgi:hypothetical protein
MTAANGVATTPAAIRLLTRESRRERLESIAGYPFNEGPNTKRIALMTAIPPAPKHAVFSPAMVTERGMEYSKAARAGKSLEPNNLQRVPLAYQYR